MVGNDIRNRFARFERRTANPAAPCAVDRRKRQADWQAGRPVRAFAAGAVWPRRFGDGRRRGFASVSAPTGRQGRRMASLFAADACASPARCHPTGGRRRGWSRRLRAQSRRGTARRLLSFRRETKGTRRSAFRRSGRTRRRKPLPETPLADCVAAHWGISRGPCHAAAQPRQRHASERAAEIDSADRDGWTQRIAVGAPERGKAKTLCENAPSRIPGEAQTFKRTSAGSRSERRFTGPNRAVSKAVATSPAMRR